MRLKSVMLGLLLLCGCPAGCGHGTVYVPQVDAEVVVDSAVPDAAILMDAALLVDANTAADAEVVAPDAGPPACQYFDHTGFSFTSTAAELSQSIPLDLQLDTPYRRLEIEFDMIVSSFHGECWAAPLNRLMPRFNMFLDLRRGTHRYRGGSFIRAVLRGPGSGSASWRGNDIRAYQNYKTQVFPQCSSDPGVDTEPITPEKHTEAEGVLFPVRVVYDVQNHTLEIQLDGDVFSGPTYAGEDLIARTGAPIMLFFGRDTPIDCHVPPAGVTPASECCWGAPEGWTYQNLRYWTCL